MIGRPSVPVFEPLDVRAPVDLLDVGAAEDPASASVDDRLGDAASRQREVSEPVRVDLGVVLMRAQPDVRYFGVGHGVEPIEGGGWS